MTRTLTKNQIAEIAADFVLNAIEDHEFSIVYENEALQDVSEEQQLEIYEAMNGARVSVEVEGEGVSILAYNYDVEEDCE